MPRYLESQLTPNHKPSQQAALWDAIRPLMDWSAHSQVNPRHLACASVTPDLDWGSGVWVLGLVPGRDSQAETPHGITAAAHWTPKRSRKTLLQLAQWREPPRPLGSLNFLGE